MRFSLTLLRIEPGFTAVRRTFQLVGSEVNWFNRSDDVMQLPIDQI